MERKEEGGIRLQKYLADAGVASRRKCEEYIRAGRVQVNGVAVTEMGTKVSDSDEICFDGRPVRPARRAVYIMLNKPTGVVTTMSDPEGRPTVAALVGELNQRVFPVGRLDYDTEGLLLLTNDGELANRLTHPRYSIDKQYYARIAGHISEDGVRRLTRGVVLDDGYKTAESKVRVTERLKDTSLVEVTVHEGHNRLVRRMFEAIGLKVTSLRRERIGSLSLSGLAVGRWRHLTPGEVKYLKFVTGMDKQTEGE